MSTHIECMKSEFDLFAAQSTQSSILRTEEVSYNPMASLDGASSIKFVCLGNGETYQDLSSVDLRLVVQLKKMITTALNEVIWPPKVIFPTLEE